MAWCCSTNNKKKQRIDLLNQNQDVFRFRLSNEEKIEYTEMFFSLANDEKVYKKNFPFLLGMLGTDIAESFALKVFDTFSSNKEFITLPEYLKYVDVYHHGDYIERGLITFKMMDNESTGRVSFDYFKDYLELIIQAVSKVHPLAEENLISRKEMLALFNKISNGKSFFNFDQFTNVFINKPELLSWIDYFKNHEDDVAYLINKQLKAIINVMLKFFKNLEYLTNYVNLNNENDSDGLGFDFNIVSNINDEISKFNRTIEKFRKIFTENDKYLNQSIKSKLNNNEKNNKQKNDDINVNQYVYTNTYNDCSEHGELNSIKKKNLNVFSSPSKYKDSLLKKNINKNIHSERMEKYLDSINNNLTSNNNNNNNLKSTFNNNIENNLTSHEKNYNPNTINNINNTEIIHEENINQTSSSNNNNNNNITNTENNNNNANKNNSTGNVTKRNMNSNYSISINKVPTIKSVTILDSNCNKNLYNQIKSNISQNNNDKVINSKNISNLNNKAKYKHSSIPPFAIRKENTLNMNRILEEYNASGIFTEESETKQLENENRFSNNLINSEIYKRINTANSLNTNYNNVNLNYNVNITNNIITPKHNSKVKINDIILSQKFNSCKTTPSIGIDTIKNKEINTGGSSIVNNENAFNFNLSINNKSLDLKEEQNPNNYNNYNNYNNEYNAENAYAHQRTNTDNFSNDGRETVQLNFVDYIIDKENYYKNIILEAKNQFTNMFSKINSMAKSCSYTMNRMQITYNWLSEKKLKKLIKHANIPDYNNISHLSFSPNNVFMNKKEFEKIKQQKFKNQLNIMNKYKNNSLKTTDVNFKFLIKVIMGIQIACLNTSNTNLLDKERLTKDDLDDYMKSNTYTIESSGTRKKENYFISEFAPIIFNNIRRLFGITKESYVSSISPQEFITEMMISSTTIIEQLVSTGKSGSMFYYTKDGKYIIKTITESEYLFLKKILPEYFIYIKDNKNTLLPKFYGCYKLIKKLHKNKERIYFITMDNIFSTPNEIQLRYDLKGSTHGRRVLSSNIKINKDDKYPFSLKDLDFEDHTKYIYVGDDKKSKILEQVDKDTKFLSKMKIIDYSLLVGIHNSDISDKNDNHNLANANINEQTEHVSSHQNQTNLKLNSDNVLMNEKTNNNLNNLLDVNYHNDQYNNYSNNNTPRRIRSINDNSKIDIHNSTNIKNPFLFDYSEDCYDEFSYSFIDESNVKNKENNYNEELSLKRAFKDLKDGGINGYYEGKKSKEIYYFGIIDILTEFKTFKSLEYLTKSVIYCSQGMSCVPPTQYQNRFYSYLEKKLT